MVIHCNIVNKAKRMEGTYIYKEGGLFTKLWHIHRVDYYVAVEKN